MRDQIKVSFLAEIQVRTFLCLSYFLCRACSKTQLFVLFSFSGADRMSEGLNLLITGPRTSQN